MTGRRDVLLDTGPLVALLDRRDQWHELAVGAWPDLAVRCVTTEAVITEATHLVARGGAPPGVVLEFLLAGEVPVVGLEPAGHRRAVELLRRYHRVPMDYADATLVVAAEWLRTRLVFTLDRRGFETYRSAGGGGFMLLPDRRRR